MSLKLVESHFKFLNDKYNMSVEEKEVMNKQKVEISQKMERATKLISALKHEQVCTFISFNGYLLETL